MSIEVHLAQYAMPEQDKYKPSEDPAIKKKEPNKQKTQNKTPQIISCSALTIQL